ncbi:MAG: glycosyltransferase [Pseudomonadota bacterium]
MKLLFVITGLDEGGAETMLFKLLTNINRNKYKCVVVSMLGMGVYGEKIALLGIPVHCLGGKNESFSIFSFLKFIRLVRKLRPDLIQGWMYHANFISALSMIFYPCSNVVFNIRQSLYGNRDKLLTRVIIKFNAWASHFAKKVINNSITSQKQHRKIGFSKKNEAYIANGFNTHIFNLNFNIYKKFRWDHGLNSDTKIIGNLSRYHPIKNHLGLLTIFHRVKKCYPYKIVLALGGASVDSNNLQLIDEIKRLKLEDDCILLGSVNAHEVIPAFDIYLLPSFGEGFPNVVGEAMACGVPCVATDVGDCKTIIGAFGGVAPVNDYAMLTEICIEKLNINKEKKSKIRQHIVDNYSIEKIVTQYECLYADLLT